jgi:hypothetical protein
VFDQAAALGPRAVRGNVESEREQRTMHGADERRTRGLSNFDGYEFRAKLFEANLRSINHGDTSLRAESDRMTKVHQLFGDLGCPSQRSPNPKDKAVRATASRALPVLPGHPARAREPLEHTHSLVQLINSRSDEALRRAVISTV